MLQIAQITDPHLPVLNRSGYDSLQGITSEYDLFTRTIEKMARLSVDVLVLSGDILGIDDDRDPAEMREGDSAPEPQNITESYRKIHAILDASGLTYLIVPGNHDRESAFRQVFDGCPDRAEVFGYTIILFYDREGDNRIPERKGGELEKFKGILNNSQKNAQIHVQHYLLTDPPEYDHTYSYKRYKKLQRDITDSHKVILCISGHYHKGTKMIDRSGTFFTSGAAFCAPHRAYRIYRVSQRSVTYEEYRVI
jgi:hypothetical protein